jgi:uncharacterized protein YegP (UPF0339 family)
MIPTKSIWAILTVATLAMAGCTAETSDEDAAGANDSAVVVAQAKARIETFDGIDGQFYFHLVAKNGEIVLRSEGYGSKQSAENGAQSVLQNAQAESAFELRDAQNGEAYFVIKAANHEVIGVSETYVSRSNAQRAAATVRGLVTELVNARPSPAKREGRFETFTGADRLSYFHLRAGNGQVVLQSQGYQTLASAKKGVTAVRSNAVDAAQFSVLEGSNGQFYFRLKARNNEIIARSEMYATKQNAERGRDAVIALLSNEDQLVR